MHAGLRFLKRCIVYIFSLLNLPLIIKAHLDKLLNEIESEVNQVVFIIIPIIIHLAPLFLRYFLQSAVQGTAY